jgi:hypothetical protein
MSPQARRTEDAAPFSFTRRAVNGTGELVILKAFFKRRKRKEWKVQGKT